MRDDNLFRVTSRELKPNEITQIEMIKNGAADLLRKFPIGTPNAKVAQRRLQEAVFWAVYDISG